MTDRNSLYMTYDEYEEFIHRAHSSYMSTKYASKTATNHISDVAINSAEFFEIAYHVLTELASVIHVHDAERYQKMQNDVERMVKAQAELAKQEKIDNPLWHEPSGSNNTKKKKNKKKLW